MTEKKPKVLIVDDEVGIRELLGEILFDEGFAIDTAENAEAAWEKRLRANPDVVLLDIWMPDVDGITLLKKWKEAGLLTMPILVMSGHATIETAVEAVKLGAMEVLEKPIAMGKLISAVKEAVLRAETPQFDPVIRQTNFGKTSAMRKMKEQLLSASGNSDAALFIGDPNAGVYFFAHFLARTDKPWLSPRDPRFLETGPAQILREADQGVIYIRFINLLNAVQQRGMLMLLREAAQRDTRVIAESLESVRALESNEEFNPDLAEFLARQIVEIPPLEKYTDDIPEIIALISRRLFLRGEAESRKFSQDAIKLLEKRRWADGFMGLYRAVRDSLHAAEGDSVDSDDVEKILAQIDRNESQAAMMDEDMYRLSLREARDAFEREYFRRLLISAKGSFQRAAQLAGLERTYLYRKLKQLSMAEDRPLE